MGRDSDGTRRLDCRAARRTRLGRPRPDPVSGADRPAAHAEALGALLARGRATNESHEAARALPALALGARPAPAGPRQRTLAFRPDRSLRGQPLEAQAPAAPDDLPTEGPGGKPTPILIDRRIKQTRRFANGRYRNTKAVKHQWRSASAASRQQASLLRPSLRRPGRDRLGRPGDRLKSARSSSARANWCAAS